MSDIVYVTADEVSIASILNETVAKFPTVSFGSYPKMFHRLVTAGVGLFIWYLWKEWEAKEFCGSL